MESNPSTQDPSTKMDTKDKQAKTKEKDQMVGLNDKFVALIEKVQKLEEENKVLSARLKLLLEQEAYKGKIDEAVKKFTADMQDQIDELQKEKQKLKKELTASEEEMEDTKKRYEDELQKKVELENNYVVTKKDADESALQRVKMELELEDIKTEQDFLRHGFDEEIKELHSLIHNEAIKVETDDPLNLDMDEILKTVKAQYEEMAAQSRAEVEQWNKKKMDDMVQRADKNEQEVKDIKKEIADTNRFSQKLSSELDILKIKKNNLEADLITTQENGEKDLDDAREKIQQLEEALRKAKQQMAKQIRDYQDLMNLKLALDIEITTYKKLLEGEEMRMTDYHRNMLDF